MRVTLLVSCCLAVASPALATPIQNDRGTPAERQAEIRALERELAAKKAEDAWLRRVEEQCRAIQGTAGELEAEFEPGLDLGLDLDARSEPPADARLDAPLLTVLQDDPTEMPEGQSAMSEAELSRQISNPVGNLWLLFFQHDVTVRDIEGAGDNQIIHNLKFQPVTPIALTDEWRLISRPVLQFNSFDIPQADGSFDTDTGLGDTVWLQLLSNSDPSEKWMTGLGPTWIFPTATEDSLGGENWAVGPSALAIYLGGPGEFIAGGLAQHWWDFAGAGDQLNLTDFQYILRYRVTETFNIGMAPNIQYDWVNEDWSIPVGGGFDVTTKIGNLPIRFGIEGYYYLDEFDGLDNQWGVRLFLVPVVPSPEWASQPLFGR